MRMTFNMNEFVGYRNNEERKMEHLEKARLSKIERNVIRSLREKSNGMLDL